MDILPVRGGFRIPRLRGSGHRVRASRQVWGQWDAFFANSVCAFGWTVVVEPTLTLNFSLHPGLVSSLVPTTTVSPFAVLYGLALCPSFFLKA